MPRKSLWGVASLVQMGACIAGLSYRNMKKARIPNAMRYQAKGAKPWRDTKPTTDFTTTRAVRKEETSPATIKSMCG